MIQKFLTGFIRDKSPFLPDKKIQDGEQQQAKIKADIQVALDVISNLNKLNKEAGIEVNQNQFDLSYTNLREAKLKHTCFEKFSFRDSFLEKADFWGAELSGARFTRASLIEADFREANLKGASFKFANLKGVKFTNADLERANFNDVQNLQIEQIKEAKNWDKIINYKELEKKLYCKRRRFRLFQK